MTDSSTPPLESSRAYQYLLLVELLLAIAFFAVSIAVAFGLL